jgi:hypothetical protein
MNPAGETPKAVPSLSYDTQTPPRRLRWRRVIVAVLTPCLIVVLFCSGLPFPIMGGATSDLSRKMRSDFGMTLPAGAVVTHGARIAERDPMHCYTIQFPTGQATPFIASLQSAATARRLSITPQATFNPLGPLPSWFNPTQHSDLVILEIGLGSHDHSWRWSYSPSADRGYVEYITY